MPLFQIKISFVSFEEVPKTWRGKVFLVALFIMACVLLYTIFFNQSLLWIGASIGVIAFTVLVAFITGDETVNLKSLKEVFNDVEVINDGAMCKYPQKPRFLNYPQAIKHLKIHRAWKLWEKIGTTKRDYDEVMKQVKEALANVLINDVWNAVSFNIERWGGTGKMPSNWYLDTSDYAGNGRYNLVEAIIKEYSLHTHNRSDGRLMIVAIVDEDTDYIAGANTETRRAELLESIQEVIKGDETKKLIGKVQDAKDKLEEAEKAFNKKLAKIVRNMNFKAGGVT